tara:strand:- start:1015 stop:1719 length:705 start_codon:yes stop_codon:yes gene_type:complete
MIKKIINILSLKKKSFLSKKISYSYNGVDLIISYLFQKERRGTYVDVGAQNPISNNNTFLLFKKGWRGLNIDLDNENIKLFNIARPLDKNFKFAVSDKKGEKKLFFYHDKSPINTLVKKVSRFQKAKISKIENIKVVTLNYILSLTNIKKIDFLNIDVEGHELEVLKGFDLKTFKPKVINVEFLDLSMKNLHLRNNDLNKIIKSDLYRYLIRRNYHLINWLHGDLIFVHSDLRD